jgi:hypothetical protein
MAGLCGCQCRTIATSTNPFTSDYFFSSEVWVTGISAAALGRACQLECRELARRSNALSGRNDIQCRGKITRDPRKTTTPLKRFIKDHNLQGVPLSTIDGGCIGIVASFLAPNIGRFHSVFLQESGHERCFEFVDRQTSLRQALSVQSRSTCADGSRPRIYAMNFYSGPGHSGPHGAGPPRNPITDRDEVTGETVFGIPEMGMPARPGHDSHHHMDFAILMRDGTWAGANHAERPLSPMVVHNYETINDFAHVYPDTFNRTLVCVRCVGEPENLSVLAPARRIE